MEELACPNEDEKLCPKQVGTNLGISTRSAQRLMASGAIRSWRIGPGERLLQTMRGQVEVYRRGQVQKG